MQDIGVPVKHVSDTAFVVAAARAEESKRPDATFHDPLAETLAGPSGVALRARASHPEMVDWMMATRTCALDRLILDRISHGVDTIVNLAAGLDTRPYRLALPSDLLWIEVDLPGIIQYKAQALEKETPACRLERHALDLSGGPERKALFTEIDLQAGTTLVITEGLLIYLQPEDVTGLARDLAATNTFRYWLMDLTTPKFMEWARRLWQEELAQGDVRFHFAPPGVEFFESLGWKLEAFRSFEAEGRTIRREPPEAAKALAPHLEEAIRESGMALFAAPQNPTRGSVLSH